MAEVGIDITGEFPKPWTDEIVRAADVVVTMGCGDACPLYPGKRYEDWELDDPAGHDVAAVRPIRDEIRRTRRSAARLPRRDGCGLVRGGLDRDPARPGAVDDVAVQRQPQTQQMATPGRIVVILVSRA